MESAPTANGKRRGQPGKHNLRVIANLCRGRCSHRPGNPAAARTPAGGINPAPTNNFFFWPTGMAAAVRAAVGRDAPSRRTLRRCERPRAGMESAPTDKFCVLGQTGRPPPNRMPAPRLCIGFSTTKRDCCQKRQQSLFYLLKTAMDRYNLFFYLNVSVCLCLT